MTFEPIEVSLDENCISDFIRRYHFNEDDKNEIVRLYRKVFPRVHAAFYHVIEEDEKGDKSAIVVASLGRAFDEFQSVLVREEDIHGAYIVDCLGLELLSLAYSKIDEKLHEFTGLFPGGYVFAGSDELPLERIPEIMKMLGQKKIKYNEAFVLIPKKSVLFVTKLHKEKQEKHSRCSMCNAVKCTLRMEAYIPPVSDSSFARDKEVDKVDKLPDKKENGGKQKGLIHLYTGEGKGKTTAAIGLAIRAAGAGKKVVFTQFMKGRQTSELRSFEKLENITVIRSQKNLGWFKKGDPASIEAFTNEHNRLLDDIENEIDSGHCDVLVMDESTYPYNYGIIDKKRFEKIIVEKPEAMEIILTGRNADQFFTDHADYITSMEKIKHPYDRGVEARLGIEY